MNILLINHYAGTPRHGMEYRPHYFAREWVRAGHRVLVVAASFSHLRQINPSFAGPLSRETIDGVEYLWLKTPAYSGNGPARVRNMLAFVSGLAIRGRPLVASFSPDAVIASSTYTWDNWPAARIARKHSARYVYELHDLWPMSPMALGGMSPHHPFIWSLQRAEDYACRHADSIVSLLPHAREHLELRGMPTGRFAYVPNGILPEDWNDPAEIPASHLEALQQLRREFPLLVGYAGGHALSNALDVLVEAGAMPALGNVGIVCVGGGAEKNRLESKAIELGSNVRFLPPVPRSAVPSLLKHFDVLYLGWMRSPLYRFGISPNKLFEYMMAGVPIVHAVEAANDPVEDAGCGISVTPEDTKAVSEAILRVCSLPADERAHIGARGKRYVEEHHNIHRLAIDFLDCLSQPADVRKDTPPAIL